jgi:hypothetical protein
MAATVLPDRRLQTWWDITRTGPLSRVVFSCYQPGEAAYGGGGALVVSQITTLPARRHDVTVVPGPFPACAPFDDQPYREVFLSCQLAGPVLVPVNCCSNCRPHRLFVGSTMTSG